MTCEPPARTVPAASADGEGSDQEGRETSLGGLLARTAPADSMGGEGSGQGLHARTALAKCGGW